MIFRKLDCSDLVTIYGGNGGKWSCCFYKDCFSVCLHDFTFDLLLWSKTKKKTPVKSLLFQRLSLLPVILYHLNKHSAAVRPLLQFNSPELKLLKTMYKWASPPFHNIIFVKCRAVLFSNV